MTGKTIVEVRDRAKAIAERKGHKIKRWNSRHSNGYTAVCIRCRAQLSIYSRLGERPNQPDYVENGVIIARDRELYWTGRDYNYAEGAALVDRCW